MTKTQRDEILEFVASAWVTIMTPPGIVPIGTPTDTQKEQ